MAQKPDFIHIGPGRTGTTYIFKILGQHPEIALPRSKEINYFNRNYDKGEKWYFSYFQTPSGKISGDFSNLYFSNNNALKRIASELPDIKVICVLRNPYDRALSNFFYQQRSGSIAPGLTYTKALEKHPDLTAQDVFSRQLSLCHELFGDRLFIGFYDDLKQNPESFFASLFEFLGVSPNFKPDNLEEKVNSVVSLKYKKLSRLFRFSADLLRSLGLTRLLDGLKNSKTLAKLIYIKKEKSEVDFPRSMIRRMNKDIDQLMKLSQRDLSHWKR